jgi:glycosyltransferase involved in cell wall biosynthesis
MKKIAFIVRLFQDKSFYAGSEKFLYKLIEEFIKHGYLVDVYCNELEIDTKVVLPNYKSNVIIKNHNGINEIILCDNGSILSIPEQAEAYYEKIKKATIEKEYDFVFTNGITPHIDLCILQVHSLIHNRFKNNNFFMNLYYKKYKPKMVQNAYYEEKWITQDHRKIFVVSNKLKDDYVKNFGIPENKISVIYPGIEYSEKIDKSELHDLFTFGISATFFKRKGGLLFLRALRKVKQKKYKFKAYIILRRNSVSKKRWLNLLLKVFNISKEVEFITFQNDMKDFYKKIDCMVMPSHEEAFGLVALESMINKIPCIVSSCSGVSEIIKDGVDGFIFDINNKASSNLAKKMIYILNNSNKINEFVLNAYETAKKYTWNHTFLELEKHLNELTEKESNLNKNE